MEVVETAVATPKNALEPMPGIDVESIEILPSISSQLEGNELQLRTPAPDILMQMLLPTFAKQKSLHQIYLIWN